MKISVIVPIYNVSKYLERGLNSLVKQKNFSEIEVILVNDGSTDKSLEICEVYRKKYKNIKLISKENGGVSSARNIGIKNSTSKYLAFFDPDDEVEEQYYQYLLNLANEYSVELISTDFKLKFNEKITIKKKKDYKIMVADDREKIKKIFLKGGIISNNLFDKLYLTSVCKKVMFDEKIRIGEDMKFIYDYINKITSIHIDTKYAGYIYYKNESSAMNRKFNEKFFDALKVSEQISTYEKGKSLYKYAVAHEYHERCKLLEYMIINNGRLDFSEEWNEEIYKLKKYNLISQFKYHSLRQWLGILLMRLSPWLYINIHKMRKIG